MVFYAISRAKGQPSSGSRRERESREGALTIVVVVDDVGEEVSVTQDDPGNADRPVYPSEIRRDTVCGQRRRETVRTDTKNKKSNRISVHKMHGLVLQRTVYSSMGVFPPPNLTNFIIFSSQSIDTDSIST